MFINRAAIFVDGIPSAKRWNPPVCAQCANTGGGDSRYSSFFSFSRDPQLISLDNYGQTNFREKKKKKKKKYQEILVFEQKCATAHPDFRRFERNVGEKECLTSFIPSEQNLIHETCLETYNCLSLATGVIGGEIGLRIITRRALMEWPAKRWHFYQSWNRLFTVFERENVFVRKQKKKKKIFL